MRLITDKDIIVSAHKKSNDGKNILLEFIYNNGEFKEVFKDERFTQIYFSKNNEGDIFSLYVANMLDFEKGFIFKRWERIEGRNFNSYYSVKFDENGEIVEYKRLNENEIINLGDKNKRWLNDLYSK